MPGKLLKKILEESKQNDEQHLSIIDQGVSNLLDVPELCKNEHYLLIKNFYE